MTDTDRPETVIHAHSLSRTYRLGTREIPVLLDVSFDVRRGETVCIRGASGAGKTTLLHIIGGLERPTGGTVDLLGSDLYRLSEKNRSHLRGASVGFVFQAYHLLPELTVAENVVLPALRRAWRGKVRNAAEERARELLDRVGLAHRLDHRPAELSGGEQQRAAIARALINEPEIVLADEPTGNLDSQAGDQVLDLLLRLAGDTDRTLVVVTHNDHVAERCGRCLMLADGTMGN